MIAARTPMKWIVCRADPNSSKGPIAYYRKHDIALCVPLVLSIERTYERGEATLFEHRKVAKTVADLLNQHGPVWERESPNLWGITPATIEVPEPIPAPDAAKLASAAAADLASARADNRPARVWRVSHDGADQWHIDWDAAREALFAGPPDATMRGVDLPQNGMQLIDLLQHERERIEAEIEERRAGEAAAPPKPAVNVTDLSALCASAGTLRASTEPAPATPEDDPEETYLRLASISLNYAVPSPGSIDLATVEKIKRRLLGLEPE